MDYFPPFARLRVTTQVGRMIIYFMAYAPKKRDPNIEMIEEGIKLHNLPLRIRRGKTCWTQTNLLPDFGIGIRPRRSFTYDHSAINGKFRS